MEQIENITLEEAPREVLPKCPYCKQQLDRIWTKTKGIGFIGKQMLLLCPHCHSFLSYSSYRRYTV